MEILVNSTPVALWHDIIHEAEISCRTPLQEELEAYLVFLLMRYVDKPHTMKQIIATQFLENLQMTSKRGELHFQEVGDKCLLFSGLFPGIAEKRLVKIGYFVQMGQSAYGRVSKERNDLYHRLARHFVPLMDILQSVRCYSEHHPDLLPLQAYDLWNETGSKRALSVLKKYTHGIPTKIK
jgi:hypothetical protein